MSDTFALRNDPPKPPRGDFTGREKQQQKVLFTGLDCLPGQQDLFAVDGSPELDSDAPEA